MKELSTVVLTRNIKDHSLKKGDIGTIVHTYEKGNTVEVEFVTPKGKTVAVLTLNLEDIRPIAKNEILHVRGFSAVSM